jgi:hypothetical protein
MPEAVQFRGQAPYGFSASRSAYHGPDPQRSRDQLQLLQTMYQRWGPVEFARRAFWIIRKNPEEGEIDLLPRDNRFWNRRLVPYVHNRIQRDLDAKIIVGGSKRNIILKPRQVGLTTWIIIMRLLLPVILEPGAGSMLISQNAEYATAHFGILKLAYRHFMEADPYDNEKNEWAIGLRQHLLHIAYSNRRELIFDQIDSRVRCASAEVEETGQGFTIQHLACTEVSRWQGKPEETLANAKEAIPADGTMEIECTPNGAGGYFFEEWNRSTSGDPTKREFMPHFHPWWWQDEYRRKPAVPMSQLTDEERTLVMAHGLDGEQITWRREKVESLRHNFAEKYAEDPISCFILSGNAFFEKEILNLRYHELQTYTPLEKFNKLTIFKKVIKHRRYIIGVDVATGLPVTSENPDFSAAVVIDQETGEEMAAYRAHVLPEELAHDMFELGTLYNNAEVAIERNNEGGTVIMALKIAEQYGNIYTHKDWWKRDWQNTRFIEGFLTTQKTRPIALNRIRWMVAHSPETIHDLIFIGEAMSFIHDEKTGKPQAAKGAHDDTVMCRAIAHYVRAVRLGYLTPEQLRSEKYGATPQEVAPPEEQQT